MERYLPAPVRYAGHRSRVAKVSRGISGLCTKNRPGKPGKAIAMVSEAILSAPDEHASSMRIKRYIRDNYPWYVKSLTGHNFRNIVSQALRGRGSKHFEQVPENSNV